MTLITGPYSILKCQKECELKLLYKRCGAVPSEYQKYFPGHPDMEAPNIEGGRYYNCHIRLSCTLIIVKNALFCSRSFSAIRWQTMKKIIFCHINLNPSLSIVLRMTEQRRSQKTARKYKKRYPQKEVVRRI